MRLLDGIGVSQEVHAPFCEGLRVKLTWPTHLIILPNDIRREFYRLYLIIDVYSRFIVGWEVHDSEAS